MFLTGFVVFAVLFFYAQSVSAAGNLISNPSLEEVDASSGLPKDWFQGRWGVNSAVFEYPVAGSSGAKAARVTLTSRTSGDAKWYTRDVAVTGGKEYVFKDDFRSSTSSFITLRFKLSDGSFMYRDIAGPGPSSTWKSSGQIRFVVPNNAVSLSVFHLINSVGFLEVDNYELSPVEAVNNGGDPANLITNPGFESATQNPKLPDGWATGKWGTGNAVFTYPSDGRNGSRGVTVAMSGYVSGDAKWYFNDVNIQPNINYIFSDFYKSSVKSYVTVRYKLSTGQFLYKDIAILPPASDWTNAKYTFTTPANAISVTIFHLINSNGTLSVDDYLLKKETQNVGGPIFSLTFDDGWKTTYQNALPIINNAGLKGSFYIITGRFDFPAYINETETLSIQSAGHEVTAHSQTHIDLVAASPENAKKEIEGSRSDLLSMGINPVNTFAYPFGSYSESVKDMVRQAGYTGARSSDTGFNNMNSDTYVLKTQSVELDTTYDMIKNWVDLNFTQKTWLILVFHRIDDSKTDYSTTPDIFKKTMDYLLVRNADVVTVSEGVNRIK